MDEAPRRIEPRRQGVETQRTTLTVDAHDYLASLVNPANESRLFTSTDDGLLTSMTDPRNHTYQFTYDAKGRLIRDDDPAGGFKTLTRMEQSNGFTVTLGTAMNRSTSYQVTRTTTGAEDRVNTFPDGSQTTTDISVDGTRTSAFPDGTITTDTQGPDPRFGMQAPVTSSSTLSTPLRLTRSQSSARTVVLANPDDPLSLTSLTDTATLNGRTSTTVYNSAARTLTTTTAAGRQTITTLDALGRVIGLHVGNLSPVQFALDSRGRIAAITQGTGADTRTQTFGYRTDGYLGSILDALGRTFGFEPDPAGRLLRETFPDGRVLAMTYDANGNLASLIPPGRPTHAFDYTAVDLESEYLPPNPQPPVANPRTSYSYNLDRQLDLITRPDGQTIDFVYDSAGHLSQQLLPGNRTITYAYDANTKNLTSITGPDTETLAFTYDGSLMLSETWSGPVTGSVSRTYDTDFRVASQSVNGANSASFGYDPDSLLTSAGSMTLTRHPQNGLLTGTMLGVVSDTIGYDTFGQPATYSASVSGSAVLFDQYTPDPLGRITEKTETIQGVTDTYAYDYDLAGRLSDVHRNGDHISHYDYDANGNRTGGYNQQCSSFANVIVDNQDRLLTIDCGVSTFSYSYSANGERSSKATGTSPTTYDYDAVGNLRSATLPDLTFIEYIVDGKGRRVGKKVNGQLTQGFLYDGQLRIVAELDGSGTVVSRFVYGEKANVPQYLIRGGVAYRLISDHLGSPRLVVNSADGSIAQRMDYDEFGTVTNDTNPGFQPFGFASGLYDRDTKLVRFGARDYDPETGRWTARDPIRFAGGDANLYGYVLNDPINGIDPNGLWNGNILPLDFRDQDNECSPPVRALNGNSCMKECCQAHDDCYRENQCYSSWIGNILVIPNLFPCEQCNLKAAACILSSIGQSGCQPPPPPPPDPCNP